ncbi:MAG: patatin-like phospholipase family protein [Clostridia bacterium]|nr:patatin-like phospholipase family protein [Clostridia bacterium]
MSWGLVLGSGGLRGAAHVGFLKVLEENNIRPPLIAGTSAGAVVAALYASGLSPSKIEQQISMIYKTLSMGSMLEKFTSASKLTKARMEKLPMGFLSGITAEFILKNLLKNKDFSRLSIPCSIVATDLNSGETVVFSNKKYAPRSQNTVYIDRTKVAEAVRASMGIPVLFEPKEIYGRMLIDGGVTNSVPVDIVMDMGAQKVIAVDLDISGRSPENLFGVIFKTIDIMAFYVSQSKPYKADLTVKPHMPKAGLLDIDKIPQLIAAGEQAAVKNLKMIKKIISHI